MQALKKQIKESFFNPILHLLPLLIFLVVADFYGMGMGWKISFPIALGLLVYMYYVYNRIFTWHLIFTLIFVAVSIIASLETLLPMKFVNNDVIYEIVFLLVLSVFLLFRKRIQHEITAIISNIIPMSNNFNELYRVIRTLFIVLFMYVTAYLIIIHTVTSKVTSYLQVLHYTHLGVLVIFSLYEVVRVQMIRSKLIKEEWWPIVSDQGKIIGNVQHQISLNDERKYLHPVVRVLLIDKSMVLMKKRSFDDPESPNLWDTSISNHLKMGETIEKCVDRSAEEKYALNNFRFMYLSNYTVEEKNEKQYAFLFVSCLQVQYRLNPNSLEQTKWWTQRQIEDNLEDGIFTNNFIMEFDLLRRSGLLETGKCECTCYMRDVIYKQTSAIEKASLN